MAKTNKYKALFRNPLFYTVPQAHVALVERLGKFNRTQKSGMNFKIPIIERLKTVNNWGEIVNKNGYFIELSEQQTDTEPRQCQTSDNVTLFVNISVFWKIKNPYRAVYNVDNLPRSVSDTAFNSMRTVIGTLDLDKVIGNRDKLNDSIEKQLLSVENSWGIKVNRVEILEINYSEETAEAMLQQMIAEKRKQALIAEAQGKAIAELEMAKAKNEALKLKHQMEAELAVEAAENKVKIAEQEAEAERIKADGHAGAIKTIAEAENYYLSRLTEKTDGTTAGKIIISQKYIDGMNEISQNPSDKVFIPNGFNAMMNLNYENTKNESQKEEEE